MIYIGSVKSIDIKNVENQLFLVEYHSRYNFLAFPIVESDRIIINLHSDSILRSFVILLMQFFVFDTFFSAFQLYFLNIVLKAIQLIFMSYLL